jgi:phenylpropionate dioxygenase-like ring-hydroxylating dioxygenase large terminal subunit
MKHDLQIEILKKILHNEATGEKQLAPAMTQIPVAAYFSDEQRLLERDQIFKTAPLVFGMSHELAEAGTYKTNDRYGVPLLLTRAADGVARTFLNVCRHRGARVANDDGGQVRKVLSCPYHGWSYDLSGELVHIPGAESFPGLDPSCNGLVELPTEERHGLVWGCLTPGAPLDIAAYIGSFDEDLAGFGLEEAHFLCQEVTAQQFNWKIGVDTFLESYHFGVLHRNSIGPLFQHDTCIVDVDGPHIREIFPRKSTAMLEQMPLEQWDLPDHSAMVYVLYPNTAWVMQRDHIELWRIYPDPHESGRCVLTMDFMTPEPVIDEKARVHFQKNVDILMKTVLEEDFPAGVGIQAGLRCGAQTHVTFGRNEPALAHFERTIASQTWDRDSAVAEAAE